MSQIKSDVNIPFTTQSNTYASKYFKRRRKLRISDKLKAVEASKHWLLLPVKLRMTELNACKNMSLGSTFRCMCNYSFCFEILCQYDSFCSLVCL